MSPLISWQVALGRVYELCQAERRELRPAARRAPSLRLWPSFGRRR
jgi:hypothetical protein